MNFPSTPSDMFNIPSPAGADVQIFTANTQTAYQAWIKPQGKTMAHIIAIGGGGGGGGGFTRTAGSAGGGGGGGACSGVARLTIPIFLLPDTLFVLVGPGGPAGAAGAAGTSGARSFVSTGKNSGIPALVLASGGTTLPGGGGGGTGAAAGAAGAVPNIPLITCFTQLGCWNGNIGVVGVAGGVQTGAVGVTVGSAWATVPVTSGAGGAGCTTTDFAGGGITANTAFETPEWNVTASANALVPVTTAVGQTGNPGVGFWRPFMFSGGGGGHSNNSGAAGAGGQGGIGSGGGGGGAGATGGAGGRGGDGIVMFFCW